MAARSRTGMTMVRASRSATTTATSTSTRLSPPSSSQAGARPCRAPSAGTNTVITSMSTVRRPGPARAPAGRRRRASRTSGGPGGPASTASSVVDAARRARRRRPCTTDTVPAAGSITPCDDLRRSWPRRSTLASTGASAWAARSPVVSARSLATERISRPERDGEGQHDRGGDGGGGRARAGGAPLRPPDRPA